MSPPTHTPGLQPCLLLLVLSSTGPTAPCFPAGLSVSTLCSSAPRASDTGLTPLGQRPVVTLGPSKVATPAPSAPETFPPRL